MISAKPKRRGWSGDRGQSLVETALTAPLLILLLVGVAELGQLAYAAIAVSNAARAGASYAAQSGATASDTIGIQAAAQNDAPSLSALNVTSAISCICSDGSSASCTDNAACPNSHIEETVTVNTSASFSPAFHLPGLPTSFTLQGQAVQKCMQ